MRQWAEAGMDILFPKFCAECKKEGEWLCERCLPAINFSQQENAVPDLDGVTAFFEYGENTASKLIKMFKYDYLLEIADIFKKIIDDVRLEGNWRDFVIIPVPLHARRQRERGFNQAEIIADMFAEKLKLEINTNLRRVVYTAQQAKLSGEARRANLKDAFAWDDKNRGVPSRNSGTPLIAGQKVLLVDDVFTTGATMQECARVLKNNGARVVWGLTLARG